MEFERIHRPARHRGGHQVQKYGGCYEYEFSSLTGADTGTSAALAVPTENFNANAKAASSVVRFIADGPTYVSAPIDLRSTRIAVFRAVPVSAP